MTTRGIDYGLGKSNIDKATGIRFGVISQNEVCQAWSDESEPDYGNPTCPKCGNIVPRTSDPGTPDLDELNGAEGWQDIDWRHEFICVNCKSTFNDDEAFLGEPIGFRFNQDGYKAYCGESGDIFITLSPYYTRAQFCSPCAPGACYLLNPTEDGERAYCFGHDWFEDGVAPYPVFSVETGEEVVK